MYESKNMADVAVVAQHEFPEDRAVGLLMDAEYDDVELASAAPAEPLAARAPAPEFHLPQVGDLQQQVSDSAHQAVGKGRETAVLALELAKRQLHDQLTAQKIRVSESLGGIRQTFDSVGKSLEDTGQPAIAGYSRCLGSGVDRAASYLRRADIEEIAHDAQDFARKNPALIIGAAFLLGVALGRFFKSSESNLKSDALVRIYPTVGDSDPHRAGAHADLDGDGKCNFGTRPVAAHDYVPGGVLGGATA